MTIAMVPRRAAITATIILSSMIYAIDWTIAVVAMPHMQGTFSATQDQISWVITSYIVVGAIAAPAAGFLAGFVGRKRLFILAIAGFTSASLLCGSAESLVTEVLFRILQGGSGAFIIPLSQAVMFDIYPREQHAKAMALWGVGIMLGPIVGPSLGGILTESLTWRWVFYINVPIGALGLIGAILFLPKDGPQSARRFDWFGFVTLGAALGILQLILDRGERQDWFQSAEIMLSAAVVATAFYLFMVHSFTARDPLVSPRLFKDRNYVLGLSFIFVYGLLTMAPMVMLPPFMQDLQDFPITTIGALLTPRGAGMMIAMMLMGRFSDSVNHRLVLAGGFGLLAISNYVMSGWNLEVQPWDIVWTGLIQGLGAGSIVVPLGVITYSTLPAADRTEASAIWNLARSSGSSIGIAVAVTVLTRMTTTNRAELVTNISPYNKLFNYQAFFGMGAGGADGGERDLAGMNLEITRQALMVGYVDIFWLGAIAAMLALPMVLLVRNPPPIERPAA